MALNVPAGMTQSISRSAPASAGSQKKGEVAIHYRDQGVSFRELKASIALGERRGATPSPAPFPTPKSCVLSAHHPWRKNPYQQMKTPAFSAA
jgi:hypothetical protein